MSGWMDSFNQAVGFTEDPAENARIAAERQQSSADRALNLQTEQYEYQKRLNEPFYNLGLPAFGTLASAITGKDSYYNDPSYKQADKQSAANALWGKLRFNKSLASADFWNDIGNGADPIARIMRDPQLSQQLGNYFQSPEGGITDAVPQLKASPFVPQDSPAFQWQKERTLADLGRTLRMQGRSNSTAGLNATGRVLGDLNATEYDKQLGRLADLTNIARGGASTLAGASAGFTNAAGSNLLNMGANQANATLAGGMLRQNNLYNNQQNAMGLANLGLKTYDYGKQQGWWGGNNDYGATWNDSGGDINKVNFGSDWGTWSDGTKA